MVLFKSFLDLYHISLFLSSKRLDKKYSVHVKEMGYKWWRTLNANSSPQELGEKTAIGRTSIGKGRKKQTLNEQPTEEVQQPAELPAAPIERSSGMESFIKYSRCFSMGLMNV